jgi:hypothetical protein
MANLCRSTSQVLLPRPRALRLLLAHASTANAAIIARAGPGRPAATLVLRRREPLNLLLLVVHVLIANAAIFARAGPERPAATLVLRRREPLNLPLLLAHASTANAAIIARAGPELQGVSRALPLRTLAPGLIVLAAQLANAELSVDVER